MNSIVKLFENASSSSSTPTHEAAIFRTQGRLGHALKDSRSPVGVRRGGMWGARSRCGALSKRASPSCPLHLHSQADKCGLQSQAEV